MHQNQPHSISPPSSNTPRFWHPASPPTTAGGIPSIPSPLRPFHQWQTGPSTIHRPMRSWSNSCGRRMRRCHGGRTRAHGDRLSRQTSRIPSSLLPPPVASPLTPVGHTHRRRGRTSQTSSAPSGNDSPTADHASSQGAQRPRTQAEIDAAMIAEEKRRRNTAASGRSKSPSSWMETSIRRADWHS
jgi:hypothetical protein